jgi:hypothetical protein
LGKLPNPEELETILLVIHYLFLLHIFFSSHFRHPCWVAGAFSRSRSSRWRQHDNAEAFPAKQTTKVFHSEVKLPFSPHLANRFGSNVVPLPFKDIGVPCPRTSFSSWLWRPKGAKHESRDDLGLATIF